MASPHSLVCIVPDLFFAVKIENLAQRHGVRVVYPRDQAAFKAALAGAALALIDSNTGDLPWLDWVSAAKADPLTRPTPILAFGSHVDATLRRQALAAGVDRYLARDNFVSALPEIIARAAHDLSDDPCGEALPAGARRGIDEFNAGAYFEQHETLELVWRAETRPVRDLYRGILQIGVALLQVERGNAPGAIKMFTRAFRWLAPFRPACQGVDVERLVREAQVVHDAVAQLGPGPLESIDRALFPRVHFVNEE